MVAGIIAVNLRLLREAIDDAVLGRVVLVCKKPCVWRYAGPGSENGTFITTGLSMDFRNGQWLKFNVASDVATKLSAAGAHQHAGMFVGVYQKEAVDATGEPHEAGIMPCTPAGLNIVMFDGEKAVNVRVPMTGATNVETCSSRDQLPPGRLAGMHPDFVPSP